MRFRKVLALIFFGLFAGILIAEGLARLILPYPSRQISLLRMRAPDLQMDAGTDLKNPNYNPFLQRRPFSQWICNGKISEQMNNEGFRDRDFVLQKTGGKHRMAVLGDSFTEGWMAPVGHAWPQILESKSENSLEVMNFGLANRSPLRYLALYDQIVRKYHPEVVLVCLYRNDLAEDEALSHYVTFDQRGVPSRFDYVRYFHNTPRMPQTQWEKKKDKLQWFLCRYSRIYPYAAIFLIVDTEFRKRILDAPPPENIASLWAKTSHYLLTLKELVEKDHALFFLSYAPDEADFEMPNPLQNFAVELSKNKNIHFFDGSAFLALPHKESLYIVGDGHFSSEGHRRYAEMIAQWLIPIVDSELRIVHLKSERN